MSGRRGRCLGQLLISGKSGGYFFLAGFAMGIRGRRQIDILIEWAAIQHTIPLVY
jgi:hypothetical protein